MPQRLPRALLISQCEGRAAWTIFGFCGSFVERTLQSHPAQLLWPAGMCFLHVLLRMVHKYRLSVFTDPRETIISP
jgi:hypothetical protein